MATSRPVTALLRFLAGQAGHPSGWAAPITARLLDRNNGAMIRAAVDALAARPGDVVADIGFGGGRGLELLLADVGPSGRVHGVEPSAEMLRRANRRCRRDVAGGRLTLSAGTMADLSMPDGVLDGWISVNTVYFVEDLGPSLRELRRVLAPGGRGVLGVVDASELRRIPFTRHGFVLRSVPEVIAELAAAGLAVEADLQRHSGKVEYHLLVCRAAEA